jgi:hypothetical protein
MGRKKVGPVGAVERYKEEMSKPDKVENFRRGIAEYLADPTSLNLTKFKLMLYRDALLRKANEIRNAIKAAVDDYQNSLGGIPRHRKQIKARQLEASQKATIEASVENVRRALATLAVAATPAV